MCMAAEATSLPFSGKMEIPATRAATMMTLTIIRPTS